MTAITRRHLADIYWHAEIYIRAGQFMTARPGNISARLINYRANLRLRVCTLGSGKARTAWRVHVSHYGEHLVLSRFLTLYRELINLDEPMSKPSIDRQTHFASLSPWQGHVVKSCEDPCTWYIIRLEKEFLLSLLRLERCPHRFMVSYLGVTNIVATGLEERKLSNQICETV